MELVEMIDKKQIYINVIKEAWHMTEDTFPDFLPSISKECKTENEAYLKTIIDKFQSQLKSLPRLPFGRKKWKNRTISLLKDILYNEAIINLHNAMEPKTIDAVIDEVLEFMRQVRKFAPELTFADIGQAIRNYIVYAMFKEIHLEKSGFNKAAFGYSMLYPFTDNFIDNGQCTIEEKRAYNLLIQNKLQGKPVYPKSVHQSKTCELLQAIEDNYPRATHTEIYQLLLLMLEAQEISIKQQNNKQPLSNAERLDISVYKGGISVLIDRFIVKKKITTEDFLFYLGFGFFLQLADDLQDIREDSTNGHSTLFTFDLKSMEEEKVVNKLLNYVHHLVTGFSTENNKFQNFVLNACYQLICTSAIQCKEYFSPEYLTKLENYLPVSISFLENYKDNRIETMETALQKKYMKILDVMIS